MDNKKSLKLNEMETSTGKNLLTRRDLLRQSGKFAVGFAGFGLLSSLNLGCKAEDAKAAENTGAEPNFLGYTKISDAGKSAIQDASYSIYTSHFCAYAVINGIFDALRESDGGAWNFIPKAALRGFHGGIAGWGTACGTLVAGAYVIGLVVNDAAQAEKLISDLFSFYSTQNLPIYEPSASMTKVSTATIQKSISNSPLCHVSVGKWMSTQGVTFATAERKDRCARIAADVANKTVELLNEWKDGKIPTTVAPVFAKFTEIGRPTPQYNCSSCHPSKSDVTP